MKINITLGACEPKIITQLASQKVKHEKSKIELYQADADAITRLCVRGYLPPSDGLKLRNRLIKRIETSLKKEDSRD